MGDAGGWQRLLRHAKPANGFENPMVSWYRGTMEFRSNVRRLVSVSVLAAAVGCGSIKMTTTGPPGFGPKPSYCDYSMFTTMPEGDWTEIAVIDVTPGGYGHHAYTDIAKFNKAVRSEVCAAGGDAVIAFANGHGVYIKATVLKRMGPGPAPAPAAAPPAEPSVKQPERDSSGCRNDTQCKGDRICVKGECMAPEPGEEPATTAP